MTRLTRIDNDSMTYFDDNDECYHYGEYTSGGGFSASETNSKILNLKIKPNSAQGRIYYKNAAIEYWGKIVAASLNLPGFVASTTFVPMPCSKPVGHEEYDDRMYRVLQVLLRHQPGLDIRQLLIQRVARNNQHHGGRLRPAELLETMGVDDALAYNLKPNVIIIDDVVTMGASYNAAKTLISRIPGVQNVFGLFLAKTVWPRSELDVLLDALIDPN